ncbi:peptidase S8/S53 domain-containing protein [Lasiosphaeria hispida]|uniref:Peptidase S8/S53 domain-containing protein n=1 Tax=Lasiosphaeria hispida TaxID=260671 RepID=A0AAJ0HN87_9PEZI|nr:peptidase S8/S53 domain-containing protein [Lasiosphaeria hispida]
MLPRNLAIAAALAAGVAAGLHSPGDGPAVPTTHQVHERQDAHWSTRWEKRDRVQPRTVLPVRVGLVQSNLEAGERLLGIISDPTSPNYGKHLSAEEVTSMFAPSDEAVDAVRAWLVGAGFAADSISLSANKQWVQFDAHAADVEDLLATNFFEYHSRRGNSGRAVAAEAYHVPLELRQHIDYITPGIRLRAELALEPKHGSIRKGAPNKRTVRTGASLVADADTPLPLLNSTACDYYLTTACIRAQYQIPNNTVAAPGNELGIFASLNDHYSRANLDTFFTTLYSDTIPNGTYPEQRLINGAIGAVEDVPGSNATTNGGESDLDLQAAWPLIYPQRAVIFQTDDQFYETNQTTPDTPYRGFWNTFYDALDGSYCTFSAFGETGDCTESACLDPVYPNPNDRGGYQGLRQCGVFTPTNVISISYSGGEADFPASYLRRQCAEIMKLALQGVTVVESSGDNGVAGYEGDPSLKNGCAGEGGRVFYPSADVTCPYVLAVGATRLNHTSPNSTTYFETAWEYSGGGFSNSFDAPPWQKRVVEEYFSSVRLNFTGYESPGENFSHVGQGVYRKGGRGYPDVAAMGRGYFSFTEGKWSRQGGTSLSAPLWAAVLTLVNGRRLAAGKSTVGLVHPILYAHPEIFADVTQGANPGCNTTGFPAARGWDPVTGLGTPIFPKLVEVFLRLP